MRIVKHETTSVTTIRLDVCVELPSSACVSEFLAYIRAYGKSGIAVDTDGTQRPIQNIEKVRHVENVRDLILTIADEPHGLTSEQIYNSATELGYVIKKNTLGGALAVLKQNGKLTVIEKVKKESGRFAFVYRTAKSPTPHPLQGGS